MVVLLVVGVRVVQIMRRNKRKIRDLQKELANKEHGRVLVFLYARVLILNCQVILYFQLTVKVHFFRKF